jgi:hypothetical protein
MSGAWGAASVLALRHRELREQAGISKQMRWMADTMDHRRYASSSSPSS